MTRTPPFSRLLPFLPALALSLGLAACDKLGNVGDATDSATSTSGATTDPQQTSSGNGSWSRCRSAPGASWSWRSRSWARPRRS